MNNSGSKLTLKQVEHKVCRHIGTLGNEGFCQGRHKYTVSVITQNGADVADLGEETALRVVCATMAKRRVGKKICIITHPK